MRKFLSIILIYALLIPSSLFAGRANPIITNFTAGEVSKQIYGRVDISQYYNAADTAENGVVLPFGGFLKRPGSRYVSDVKDHSKKVRLIPFQFNVEQAYVLEFGEEYIRFYTDNGQIVDPITPANPYEITSPYQEEDLFELKYAQSADVIHIVHPDYEPMKLIRFNNDSWLLVSLLNENLVNTAQGIFGSGWLPGFPAPNAYDGSILNTASKTSGLEAWVGQDFGVGNLKRIRVLKIYAFSALSLTFSFQYSDDAVLWVDTNIVGSVVSANSGWNNFDINDFGTHRYWRIWSDTAPATGALNEFEMAEGAFDWIMPFLPQNTTAITLDANALTGDITITSSSGFFTSTMVGTQFKLHDGIVLITDFTSDILVSASVIEDLSSHVATTEWSEGAWSDKNGFPRAVSFYEQRLFFASSNQQPQTVWGSQINDFNNFGVGSLDTDALNYTISAEQVNLIQWLSSSSKVLFAGTSGGAFVISSGNLAEPLTPTNVVVHRESSYGVSSVSPKKIGSYLYYFQRNGRTLREIAYNFDIDSYLATDLTILSEHITKTGIVDMDYQQSPYNTLWCVRTDGEIATITREIQHKVMGWSRIVTDGEYESVASIPNGQEDQVWVSVARDIDGGTKRFIEYILPYDFGDDQEDAFYVDSGLTYDCDSVAITIVTGLDHLEGETVSILGDGLVQTNKVVSGGSITIDTEANVIHAGLPYTYTLKTLPVEAGATLGTASGKKKKISKVGMRLFESGTFQIGTDTSLKTYSVPEIFTGYKITNPKMGYHFDAQITVKQAEPLPMCVNALMPFMETNE